MDVSLVEHGLLYRVARALGAPPGKAGLVRTGLVIGAVLWTPLLILSLMSHGGADPAIPFHFSFGTHTRLLITIPLFFLAEAVFDARAREVLVRLVDGGIVAPVDRARIGAAIAQAVRGRGSWLTEAVLIALAIILLWAGVRTDSTAGLSTWRTAQEGAGSQMTPAGWWYTLVVLPVFQFLAWRWFAFLIFWARLLWRISRLDLQLIPTHPDQAGGLGGFGVAHVDFAVLSFAAAAVIAASFAEVLFAGGASIQDYVLPFAGVVVGNTVALIAPLGFFFRRLLRLRQQGILEYGQLAAEYVRAFDTKWLRGGAPPGEPLLGSADVQSLADLSNSFQVVRNIRLLPIAPLQLFTLAVAAALPSAPLALMVLPLDELIMRGTKAMLGI